MTSLKFISIPEEKTINGSLFPLTIAPNDSIKTIGDTVEFLKQNLDLILSRPKLDNQKMRLRFFVIRN